MEHLLVESIKYPPPQRAQTGEEFVDPTAQLGPKILASIVSQADPLEEVTFPELQSPQTPSAEYRRQSVMVVAEAVQVLSARNLSASQVTQTSDPTLPEVTAHPEMEVAVQAPALRSSLAAQVAQLSLSAQVTHPVATLAEQAAPSRENPALQAEQIPSPE